MAAVSQKSSTSELDEILEDIPADMIFHEQKKESTVLEASTSSSSSVVTSQILLTVLTDIQQDAALPDDFRAIAKSCQEKVDDLRLAMTFLSECINTTRKFPSSAKEASWGSFHSAVIINTPHLTAITESTRFASWFCLKVFTYLLDNVYSTTKEPSHLTTTKSHCSKDNDIVAYIGGSVVSKLKKAAYRLSDEEKSSSLDILSRLIDLSADNASNSLTDILDRGGLLRLHPQIQEMFLQMEITFLEMFSGSDKVQLSAERYESECLKNDSVLCGYYETVYESNVNETLKMQILRKILELYFRIRAHHKCKSFMDQHCLKNNVAKKQKPLRQRVKAPQKKGKGKTKGKTKGKR